MLSLVGYNGTAVSLQGYCLFWRVGTVLIPEGMTQTTYTAGMQSISDDIKLSCAYYLMDEFSVFANPYGAVDSSMGKRRQSFAMQQGKTPNVMRAQEILDNYRRRT